MSDQTTTVPGARWQDLKEILGDALEKESAAECTAFLERACAGDAALLRQAARLLSHQTDAFEAFADEAAARLRQDSLGLVGSRLGAYIVREELGRGGMGTVYLAQRADGQFTKTVAIKILKLGTDTDEILRRFHIEREILARLEHPNITRLLDAGTTAEGLPYFIMEFVDGAPITTFVAEQNLACADIVALFLKVCGAVEFAHRRGVVHRDIKPGNIWIGADGEPKLLDFGIAKVVQAPEDDVTLTQPIHLRLTPKYAAPEQIAGRRADVRSDIYSLGAVLLELLTDESRPLRTDLGRIVTRAMAADPARRYQSAAELAKALFGCTNASGRRVYRAKLLLAAAAIVGVSVSLFVIRSRDARQHIT